MKNVQFTTVQRKHRRQNINLRRCTITKSRHRHLTRESDILRNSRSNRQARPTALNSYLNRHHITTRTIRCRTTQNAFVIRSTRSIDINVPIISRRHLIRILNRVSIPTRKFLLRYATEKVHTRRIRPNLASHSGPIIHNRFNSILPYNLRIQPTVFNVSPKNLIKVRDGHDSRLHPIIHCPRNLPKANSISPSLGRDVRTRNLTNHRYNIRHRTPLTITSNDASIRITVAISRQTK